MMKLPARGTGRMGGTFSQKDWPGLGQLAPSAAGATGLSASGGGAAGASAPGVLFGPSAGGGKLSLLGSSAKRLPVVTRQTPIRKCAAGKCLAHAKHFRMN